MNIYFKLQFKILYRKIKAFGVPPAFAFLFLILAFFYISNEISEMHNYGTYILLLVQISFQVKLANSKKITFLKTYFSFIEFLKIRCIENMLIAIFFIGFLLYKFAFIECLLSFILSMILSFISAKKVNTIVLPTPFKSSAYEFILMFRKFWFLILVSYLLLGISIKVGNFNLGVFSLLIFGVLGIIAHVNLEPSFYVWVYADNSKHFLLKKIKTTLLSILLICTPNILIVSIIDISQMDLVVLIAVLYITLILTAFILLKYSKYPSEINLADLFLFVISAIVVPFFLVLMPMWYKKSIVQLKAYLHDKN